MRVILIKDVPKLGKVGDVREVADGYARNFLLPKKLAKVATPAVLGELEAKKRAMMARYAEEAKEKLFLMKKIESFPTLEIKAKATHEGKLYGALTQRNIAEAAQKAGLEIYPDMIVIEQWHPIKHVGEYNIIIEIAPELHAKLKIKVKSEEKPHEIV